MTQQYDPTKPHIKGVPEKIQETWKWPTLSIGPYKLRLKTEYIEDPNGDIIARDKDGLEIKLKKAEFAEYASVDGIGTKALLHWQSRYRTFEAAALDALAMNLNDLAVVGVRPYLLAAHLPMQKDDEEAVARITNKLVEECKRFGIEYVAGETATLNTLQGFELGLFVLGRELKEKTAQYTPNIGDVLIGLASNGLHSNGFTQVRDYLDTRLLSKKEFQEDLVRPTLIYLPSILELLESYREDITAMHHITGGAFTRLRHVARYANGRVVVSRDHNLKPQEIFFELVQHLDDTTIHKTFNCGIGYVIVARRDKADEIVSELNSLGTKADRIGEIQEGELEVRITSQFTDTEVVFPVE